MPGLNLTPHFKYRTIPCCQNRDIYIIEIPTIYISVNENDQPVQGENPTTIFLQKPQKFKNVNRKKRIKIDLDVC